MPNVVRFTLSTARDLNVPGAGFFHAGVLDIDANDLKLIARTRYLTDPYGAVEVGIVDSAMPKPNLPAVPVAPAADPYPQYVTDADIANPASSPMVALRAAFGARISVKSHGAVGDGAANDTAAITAAIAAAQAAGGGTVFFPAGVYRTTRLTVPGRVSLCGESDTVSRLVNISTDGAVFINFRSSFSACTDLTIDGQRAIQLSEGLAAVQFSRPNNPTAGGDNIAGGVVLTVGVSPGATSLTVNTASPGGEAIRAGEVITLVEGATYEMVRVAHTYTGGLTIPLASATAHAFTTAAKASVASTDVGISGCTVHALDRDGIAFWHVIYGYARFNRVRDASDTAIDIPDAGCRFVDVHHNDIETNGRWGVSIDTASTQYGRTADCPISDNVIRLLSGGDDDQRDGIYVGNVDRCPNSGNTVDLSQAGISGVHYAGITTSSPTIDLTVTGNAAPRAGTYGVRTSASRLRGLTVRGGFIGGVARGADLNTIRTGGVLGTEINNVTDYAVNCLADAAIVQAVTVLNVIADGNVAAVRFGGTANAGSKGVVSGSVLTGSSFDTVTADSGWTITETNNIP